VGFKKVRGVFYFASTMTEYLKSTIERGNKTDDYMNLMNTDDRRVMAEDRLPTDDSDEQKTPRCCYRPVLMNG
jgi:hypothetical protein